MNLSINLPPWMLRAACHGTDTDLFFPPRSRGDITRRAKAMCRTCPVVTDCLAYALDTHAAGIWGATTEDDRREIRGNARKYA